MRTEIEKLLGGAGTAVVVAHDSEIGDVPDVQSRGTAGDSLSDSGAKSARQRAEIALAPAMMRVAAGTFTMGDGEAHCGADQREVTLTYDFYLGKYEVTNQEYMEAAQWALDHGYITATSASARDNMDGNTAVLLNLDGKYSEIAFSGGAFVLRDAGHGINPDHPVKAVTWYGAASYCDWLSLQAGLPRAYAREANWSCNGGNPYGAEGYRLPTDAEWEYAARYNDGRIYPWGSEFPTLGRANCRRDVGWTSPVGSYPDAPAALGLSDMAGNVWEWCNDWWVCDLGEPDENPVGPTSGSSCVVRGGSWRNVGNTLRCAYRGYNVPSGGPSIIGFRVARTSNP